MLLSQNELWEGITPSREPRWDCMVLLLEFLWCSSERFTKLVQNKSEALEMGSGLICSVMSVSFMATDEGRSPV